MISKLQRRADGGEDWHQPSVATLSDRAHYPRFIKAEVNLLRLPLFALQTKGLRQLDGFECRGTLVRDGQTHRYLWRVTRHATRPFPGQLARAAHVAFLNILTEQGAPSQNPITWSWRDLCHRIGIAPSGRTVLHLKEAIRATAGVIIESSHAIYSRPAEKMVELAEDDRHIYTRLGFYSKARSNDDAANQNGVWFSKWYLDNLNALYTAPLDHELWRFLDRRSPIASRLYEYLLPTLYRPTPQLKIGYPLLAQSLPVRPERYYSDAQKQITPALNLLTQTRLLAKVTWTKKKGSVAQLSFHRGDRLPAQRTSAEVPQTEAQQTFQTFEVRRLCDPRAQQSQLVAQFHQCRWGNEPIRPNAKELAEARLLIDRYGFKKAKAMIPILADTIQRQWPQAKTFLAVDRYLPEASAEYDRAQRGRAQRRQTLTHQQREDERLQQQEADRRNIEATWQPVWDALPADQRQEIRDAVIARNPLLAKLPGVCHTKCLQELARRQAAAPSANDSPPGKPANGTQANP